MRNRMGYLTYILACIRNKPGRNLATVFCFAFIAAIIFSGQYILAGASSSVDQSVSRMGADIIVVPPAYMVSMKGVGPQHGGHYPIGTNHLPFQKRCHGGARKDPGHSGYEPPALRLDHEHAEIIQ